MRTSALRLIPVRIVLGPVPLELRLTQILTQFSPVEKFISYYQGDRRVSSHSKSAIRKGVGVRVPPEAPMMFEQCRRREANSGQRDALTACQTAP